MKAVALMIMGLGVIMFVIGFKGSQHNILPIIKGVAPAARSATNTSAGTSVITTPPVNTAPAGSVLV
jgi:hypothetical protein